MAYLTSVWTMLAGNVSTVCVMTFNMLLYFCFLRPRWKWWLYPALVAISSLTLPLINLVYNDLFAGPIAYSIGQACLGYWNIILVLIAFRELFGLTIALNFTLGILNRMFIFWGYVLYSPLNAAFGSTMTMRVSLRLVLVVMYLAICLVCWLALREKGRKLIQTLSRYNGFVLAGIAVSAKLIIDFCSNFAFKLNPYSDRQIIWAMIALCAFVVAVLGLYLYNTFTMLKHSELKADADRLHFEKEAQHRYYETQLQNQEELRRMKHDMNGHLSTISQLLAEDNQDEAVRYLSRLSDYAESRQKELYSDDPYLNAVVTNFAVILAENATPFEHDIQLGRMEQHPIEMCIVLNNALQNALEASLKLQPEQRYVKLQVKTKQSRFLFRITNRFKGELIMDGGLPHSTKKGAGHGFGLTSIRDATESLGGFVVCKIEGEMFVLDVAM